MAVSRITIYLLIFFTFISLTFFSACTVVRNYPQNRTFIYETNVQVDGGFKGDEKKELELQLEQQLHDSVKVRVASKFIYDLMNRPAAFDSLNAEKSVGFMHTLMNSLGYFRDSIFYKVKIDTIESSHQLRTTLDFHINPRTVTRLDSVSYTLNRDTALLSPTQKQALDTIQKVTIGSLPASLIKKGDPFSKYKLSAERDRLADVYRNNGYLRFSEEELLVLWDTVGIDLLRPTTDPIEELQLLQRRAERSRNPVADVDFRLRDNPDTTRTTRYYIGKVTVYPEFTSDTTTIYRNTDTMGRYIIKHNNGLFKKRIFPYYIFLNPGDLYRQSNYIKTQNKFNALAAWRLVSIAQTTRKGQDTADFTIRLTPASKYSFTTNFGVSLNQGGGGVLLAQGNLIGLALSATLQNRNFSKGANQGITSFRFGTELNASIKDLIQTKQISLGHTIQIPRLFPKFMRFFSKSKENINTTIFSVNGGITQRRDYFNLASLSASFGNQYSWRNKIFSFRLPNIEYNYLVRKDSLDTLISKNASYKYIFNTGMIISVLANYSRAGGSGNISNLLSASAELAPVFGIIPVMGLVKSRAFNTTLYQFVKVDLEYKWTKKLFRDALAFRVFGGVGLSIPGPTDGDSINRYLPFFREYFVGGPNSMRAWAVRRLGPGSTIKSFGRTEAPDRFGDIRFETNIEYRKYITTYKGISLNTALYTDIGNVWFLRRNSDFPDGEFPNTVAKFWQDLGIGVGTGLRVDFGFLKVRVDYAYKAKDPTPDNIEGQNVWFYKWKPLGGQIQLGIDYPF